MLDNLDPTATPSALLAFWFIMLASFLLGWLLAVFYLKSRFRTKSAEVRAVIRDSSESVHPMEREPTVDLLDEAFDISSPPNGIKAIQTRGRNGTAVVSDEMKMKTFNSRKDNLPKLNFTNIGEADASNKDDLKMITGIGPFIEQKLNNIGIYTFEQISRFTDEDMNTVTELIEFFPGRIKRDDWKGQAMAQFIKQHN